MSHGNSLAKTPSFSIAERVTSNDLNQSIFGAVICHPHLRVKCLLCGNWVTCTRDAFVCVPHLPSPYIAVCHACKTDQSSKRFG